MTLPVTVIQHDDDVPLARFADWLAGEEDLDLQVVSGRHDAIPVRPGAGLIVLGGEANAYADDVAPHLPATRDLIAHAVAEDIPVLGICLGHQLLAVATGGEVTISHPAGRELGAIEVSWSEEAAADPILGEAVAANLTAAASMHSDAVTSLPEGAQALAHSADYLQAFRIGSGLGVQFHPEASPELIAGWTENYPEVDSAAVLAELAAHDEAIAALGRSLARGFAREVLTRARP